MGNGINTLPKPHGMIGCVQDFYQLNALPLFYHPTVEAALRDCELPFSKSDYDFFNDNTSINLFALDENVNGRSSKISRTPNLSAPTFTVDTPMAVTAICVYAYGESVGALVEGNQMGTQAAMQAANKSPASPINLRASAATAANLLAGGVIPGALSLAPAHLEFGHPAWRFIWAWLQSFNLVLECPKSSYETIIRERLVDIGNCCSLIDFSGFGNSQISHLPMVRRINERLASIMTDSDEGGLPEVAAYNTPAGTDPGYFYPINCEQNADGEITPNRTTGVDASYGRPQAVVQQEMWLRLPYPIILDTSTKIKMSFERDDNAAAAPYFERMLSEACMKNALNPAFTNAGGDHFPIHEPGQVADNSGGFAAFTQVPGGQLRVGIGLKGFQLRDTVCGALKSDIDAIAKRAAGSTSAAGAIRAFSQGTLGMPKGGVEEVDAGYAGEPAR